MKKLIIIIAVIAVSILASCGQISKPDGSKDTQTREGQVDSQNKDGNQNDNGRDTVPKAEISLEKKMTALEDSISNLNDSIQGIEKRVDKNQKAIDNCYFCQYGIIAYVAYAIAIIILFFIVNFIVLKLTEKSPEVKKKERDNSPICKIKWLETQLEELQNRYNTLSLKYNGLRKDIDSIGNNLIYRSSRIPEQSSTRANPTVRQPVVKPVTPQQNKRQTEFYLRFPGIDGSFEDKRVAKSEGYYLFELYQHNPETARFIFKPGDATLMTKAINNRAAYIEKACSPVNAFEATMSRCKPEANEYGEAKLVNGKWIITKKQKVRYE